MDLQINFEDIRKIVTICGANNVGKTNVLRSVNIFFNPDQYSAIKDSPNHKFYGTRGAKAYPEIIITLQVNNEEITIKRSFGLQGLEKTTGFKKGLNNNKRKDLPEKEIHLILNKINFFYIPSINISTPDLINKLIDEIYDIEYDKSRFRGLKSNLKESFDKYIDGIIGILTNLADEINPIFEEFNENWNVGFEHISDIKKFRDLISNDIEFFLNDKSNRHIDSKGSGLQRLGFILLHSRIINKLKDNTSILLIDEPDIYIHNSLQKKLLIHLKELSRKSQIILSSHSPVFIDTDTLQNVFLLDQKIDEAITYQRTGKTFHPLRTTHIDISQEDGAKQIRKYLGIDLQDAFILDGYNILVEGDSDKKYITELLRFLGLATPNIIPTHGVTNIEKYLDFYDSFHAKKESHKNKILVLLDNDEAGRTCYRKLRNKSYSNLLTRLEFTPTYDGLIPNPSDINQNKERANYEIEDFIYPELICELCNMLLQFKSMEIIDQKNLIKKLSSKAFRAKGVLYNLDLLKNDNNLENGHTIDITSCNVKEGMSSQFSVEANKQLWTKLKTYDKKYPMVRRFLERIHKPFDENKLSL